MPASARFASCIGALVVLLTALFAGPAAAAPYTNAPSLAVSVSNPCHGDALTVTGTGFVPGETVVLQIGNTVLGRGTVDTDGNLSVGITVPDALRGAQTITGTGSADNATATTSIIVGACAGGGVITVPPTTPPATGTSGSTAPGSSTAPGGSGVAGGSVVAVGPSRSGVAGAGAGQSGIAGGAGTQGQGAGRGPLSSTGVAVLALLVVAIGLVAVGGVLLVGGRRRRTGAAHTS